MFVCNIKINKKTLLKCIIVIFAIICISLLCVSVFKILKEIKNDEANVFVDDKILSNDIAVLTPENYTNILKTVHNDIDTYIGQKISFTGYVYRVSDINENEFILARDMKISSNETVIVGFLCFFNNAKEFENYTWVNITGTIEKSKYKNEDIPRVNIEHMEKTDIPENPIVNIPNDFFVPTAVIY